MKSAFDTIDPHELIVVDFLGPTPENQFSSVVNKVIEARATNLVQPIETFLDTSGLERLLVNRDSFYAELERQIVEKQQLLLSYNPTFNKSPRTNELKDKIDSLVVEIARLQGLRYSFDSKSTRLHLSALRRLNNVNFDTAELHLGTETLPSIPVAKRALETMTPLEQLKAKTALAPSQINNSQN
jgi:hypothetical protein